MRRRVESLSKQAAYRNQPRVVRVVNNERRRNNAKRRIEQTSRARICILTVARAPRRGKRHIDNQTSTSRVAPRIGRRVTYASDRHRVGTRSNAIAIKHDHHRAMRTPAAAHALLLAYHLFTGALACRRLRHRSRACARSSTSLHRSVTQHNSCARVIDITAKRVSLVMILYARRRAPRYNTHCRL